MSVAQKGTRVPSNEKSARIRLHNTVLQTSVALNGQTEIGQHSDRFVLEVVLFIEVIWFLNPSGVLVHLLILKSTYTYLMEQML